MSLPNKYVVQSFLGQDKWGCSNRNLRYANIEATLLSYSTVIALRVNGVVYVNGATKKLSGQSLSKTTARHVNLLFEEDARIVAVTGKRPVIQQVMHPDKFAAFYAAYDKTRIATQRYMQARKA